MAAQINRLSSLINYLEPKPNLELSSRSINRSRQANTIKIKEYNKLSFTNLSLATPNLETQLISNLSISISQGQRLLIVGNSGVGKSSLVRAIAGLWQSGTGLITRPKQEHLLFLPQRPYLILGSLEEQLLYPNITHKISAEKLWKVIKQVNLTEVIDKIGSLTVEQDWSKVLSRGEQQRLAFARLLLHQPKYAILDEATSALDEDNQNLLYKQLSATTITFISIGHRRNLLQYHQQVLNLTDRQTWSLSSAQDFSLT